MTKKHQTRVAGQPSERLVCMFLYVKNAKVIGRMKSYQGSDRYGKTQDTQMSCAILSWILFLSRTKNGNKRTNKETKETTTTKVATLERGLRIRPWEWLNTDILILMTALWFLGEQTSLCPENAR